MFRRVPTVFQKSRLISINRPLRLRSLATMTDLPPGYKDHSQRTAAEPRADGLYTVTLKKIDEINPNIRLLRFAIPTDAPPFKFLPGQWLDTFTPAAPNKPGGFTITSSPHLALAPTATSSHAYPYVELAVQRSPTNPPAAYFYQDSASILGSEIKVRVGGSFTWPHAPPSMAAKNVKRYVFVAGGVGVNPLMSMISWLDRFQGGLWDVKFLYSTKCPPIREETDEEQGGGLNGEKVLFLERLAKILVGGCGELGDRGELKLFFTGAGEDGVVALNEAEVPYFSRRIAKEDIVEALGPVETRGQTVVYICGVKGMTDELVALVQGMEGVRKENVLFEKWW